MKNTLTLPGPQKKPLCRIALAGLFALLCLPSCSEKKVEDPDIPRLKTQLGAAGERMVTLDAEIKAASGDPATAPLLIEEKELLKSRIERLKEQLMRIGGLPRVEEGAAAGGGGHH